MTPDVNIPREHSPASYREIMGIAFPLILSTSSLSLMHIIDRVFLSWYSPDALAAALGAGATSLVFVSLPLGTAGYVSTFVSQYDGARRPERIGAILWQGIYFSLIAGVVMALTALGAEPFFRFVGHEAGVQRGEVDYFRVLVIGGSGPVLCAVLASFYGGRGKTWLVMWVNVGATLLNVVLDYCWIFGKAGFPEWGIFGAACATVTATWMKVFIYLFCIFQAHHRAAFATLSAWRFDAPLFRRLLRFGLPSGLQFMADVIAITLFVLFVGRIGRTELAASSIAFSINSIVFMPMIGMAMTTSVLVGRYLGADRPDDAARATRRAFGITAIYATVIAAVLVAWPEVFLAAFRPTDPEANFAAIARTSCHLIYFIAAYSLADAVNIVYSAALKGAGDTRYVMWTLVTVASTVLITPLFVSAHFFGINLYTAWVFLTGYVLVLASAYWLRYRTGRWRSMRVIEHGLSPEATLVDGPVIDT